MTIRVGPVDRARKYTVRLIFLDPDRLGEGKRVFDVSVQDKKIERLDISKSTGGVSRALVREVKGVSVRGELRVSLTPVEGSAEPVLSGVEILAE